MARLQLENLTPKEGGSGDGESIYANDLLIIDLNEEDETEKNVMLCLESLNGNDHINDLCSQTFVFFYLSKRQTRILGEHLISISK